MLAGQYQRVPEIAHADHALGAVLVALHVGGRLGRVVRRVARLEKRKKKVEQKIIDMKDQN